MEPWEHCCLSFCCYFGSVESETTRLVYWNRVFWRAAHHHVQRWFESNGCLYFLLKFHNITRCKIKKGSCISHLYLPSNFWPTVQTKLQGASILQNFTPFSSIVLRSCQSCQEDWLNNLPLIWPVTIEKPKLLVKFPRTASQKIVFVFTSLFPHHRMQLTSYAPVLSNLAEKPRFKSDGLSNFSIRTPHTTRRLILNSLASQLMINIASHICTK